MRTTTFLLAFAAIAMLSGIVGAQYDGALSMLNLSVSPNPVVAGGTAMIRFQLYNSYDGGLYGTSLQASGGYPIFNASPVGAKVLGLVNPGTNSVYYNYTVSIPNTTPSGEYTVNFTARSFVYAATGTVIAISSMPVSFYVNNKPEIKIIASSPQPGALYSGYNQTVDLVVENVGYGTARNVSVAISGGQQVNVLSSVSSFFIPNLTRGSSVTEPILVSARNLTDTHLVANVTYYSSTLGQHFSGSQQVNLSIAPSAQFTIGSANSTAKVGATDVPMHLKVTNSGTSPAQQLQLSLQTSYPITPVASTAYVGTLQPGASTNVTFLVSIDTSAVQGNYPVTIYEQWKQPNGATNQQFSGSSNYFLTVSNGSSSDSTLLTIVVVVVVIVIAVMLVRRRQASGKRESSKKK